MNIERHEAGELFSQVVIYGETVYLAGQVGTGDSVSEQMTSVLAQIDHVSPASGVTVPSFYQRRSGWRTSGRSVR